MLTGADTVLTQPGAREAPERPTPAPASLRSGTVSWAYYVGIPYVDKGRDLDGADCWGTVRLIYWAEKRIALRSLDECYLSGKCRSQVAATVAAEKAAHWRQVETPEAFDVVTLTVALRPFHVGLCLGDGRFLHNLCVGQGSVIESLDSLRWRNRIEGYDRYATPVAWNEAKPNSGEAAANHV